MTPDLEKLRAVYPTDPTVAAILRALARARMKGRVTRVSLVHTRTDRGQMGGGRFEQLLGGFRVLAACGFGRLLEPTVRERARFEWAVHPQVVHDAAQNPAMILQPQDLLHPEATLGEPVRAEPVPAGCRRHQFELRPELAVTLILPQDLTTREAQRLGHYLLSLAS